MAAYAATVTFSIPRVDRLGRYLAGIPGTVDITNYNSTLVESTTITSKFRKLYVVLVDGPTDNGYVVEWDATSNAFKAYQGDYSQTADGALTECSDNTDVGAVQFFAIGLGSGMK